MCWRLRLSDKTVRKFAELPIYCQRRKCSPGNIVSGSVRFMQIFAGVRWRGGIKWEWCSWKWRFSHERATIHTSESKRAKFRMRRDFSFYSALQWSSYVCSIYRTYGNPVSVRFPLFQHQHSINVCFWAFHCLCKLFRLTAFQTGPVSDSNCIHA